jgi:hypothetical protein
MPRREIEPRLADSKSAVLIRHTRKALDFRSAGTLPAIQVTAG